MLQSSLPSSPPSADSLIRISSYPASAGTPFKAWWTTIWPTIEDAITNATAPAELAYVVQTTTAFNPALWAELAKVCDCAVTVQ